MNTRPKLRERRRQYWVNPTLQWALIVRSCAYWVCSALTVYAVLAVWFAAERLTAGAALEQISVFSPLRAIVLSQVCLLPIFLVDSIKLSNRVAGPLLRMQRGLRALGTDERVVPIEIRQGDFWADLIDEFNGAVARTQSSTVAAAREAEEARETVGV